MDIYEKIKAGEVISDSDFATCGETPLDIFRFFEKELKYNKNLAKEYLNDYTKKSRKCEDLESALDEIQKYQWKNCETCTFYKTEKCSMRCQVFVILETIEKANNGKTKRILKESTLKNYKNITTALNNAVTTWENLYGDFYTMLYDENGKQRPEYINNEDMYACLKNCWGILKVLYKLKNSRYKLQKRKVKKLYKINKGGK